jgi:hypothetical protein
MLDLSYFQTGTSNVQTFTTQGAWQTWVKPRGAKFVNILCIGGGGGGGSGNVLASGAGGGSAAGHVKATYQANILPDILYVQCGIGGVGGIGGAQNGGTGSLSYVAIIPDTTSPANLVCISAATTAGGGVANSSGTGGTAATSATAANAIFLNLANFTATTGIAGGAGSRSSQTDINPSTFLVPGTGGGGGLQNNQSFPGGFILAAGPIPFVSGGFGVSSGSSGRGQDGIIISKPVLAFLGGTGGGCVRTGTGQAGAGGNGAYGCGGGGGGACVASTGSTGAGGNGGDGIVIITTSF